MNIRRSYRHVKARVLPCSFLGLSLLIPSVLFGQKPQGAGTGTSSLPDSPQPKQQGATPPPEGETSKFIGYMTNRSIVFPDIATTSGPVNPGEKFKIFVNQSISPAYLLAAGVSAAFNQARDVPKAYGQGWDAYGNRYGESIARASSSSFFGTFLFASVLRQDPRFFPQYKPSFWGSVKYSVRRIVVTQTDSGKNTFDTSGILGPLAAEALSNAYLPKSEQTGAKTMERYGTDLAWRFAGNMFKNYWPTFFHDLGLNRLGIIPNPGSPDRPAPQH